MQVVLALLVGGLYAAGMYLVLRRSIIQILIGLALLSHAGHLLIFTAAGLTLGRAPLVPPEAESPVPPYADPLPQALILTSIVISFAVIAFAVALVHRTITVSGTDDAARILREKP